MYQDFSRTELGVIRVETQVIVTLVSRWLPKGVQCSAVRIRANDRLCLVVINDRREFWSREDDLRRARSITEDLRAMGMDLPRLQWIRASNYLKEHPPYAEHPLYALPSFWMNIAGGLFAFYALSWELFVIYCVTVSCVWFVSSWLVSGGWHRIKRSLPFLRRD